MSIHLTEEWGFLLESTPGTDAINPATTTHYKWGKYTSDVGDFPVEKQDFQIDYYNSLDIGEVVQTKLTVEASRRFEPVNCLPMAMSLHDNSFTGISEDTGVFTSTPETTPGTQLCSFTERYDSGNASENIREHTVFNKIKEYAEKFAFWNKSARLNASILTWGQKRVDPASDVSNVPIYPGSISDSYKRDTNTVLTWDGDSLLPYVMDFDWRVINELEYHPVDGQLYPEYISNGHRLVSWNLNVRRAGGYTKQLWVDFKDQVANKTTFPLVFKIYNTATRYKQLTFNNNWINVKKNHILIGSQKVIPTYKVSGIAKSISPVWADGLSGSTFYGQ